MKKGDKIRVLQMEDYNGADKQATQMNGRIYTVDYIDDAGQIHLQESGLAVIPNVDRFVLVDCATKFDKEMSDIYDVIDDYLKINDYIEDEDGIFLSKRGTTHLTTLRAIRSEGRVLPDRIVSSLYFCGLRPRCRQNRKNG